MNLKIARHSAASTRRVGADTPCRSTRRAFLLAAVTWPALAWAGGALGADPVSRPMPKSQAAWKIGVVHLGHQTEAPVVVGLRQGLKDLGYVEGRDFVLEIRAGRGQYSTASDATQELIKAQVQIFVSAGTIATKAVKEAAGNHLNLRFD